VVWVSRTLTNNEWGVYFSPYSLNHRRVCNEPRFCSSIVSLQFISAFNTFQSNTEVNSIPRSTVAFYWLLQPPGCHTNFSEFVHGQHKFNNGTLHATSIKTTSKNGNCGLKFLHKELKKEQPQEFKFMCSSQLHAFKSRYEKYLFCGRWSFQDWNEEIKLHENNESGSLHMHHKLNLTVKS
jgi:hypothetical protein